VANPVNTFSLSRLITVQNLVLCQAVWAYEGGQKFGTARAQLLG